MIIKVSVVIIDGVLWEQNEGMLVWLGGNVLGCLLGIQFCRRQRWGDWSRCCVVSDHSH